MNSVFFWDIFRGTSSETQNKELDTTTLAISTSTSGKITSIVSTKPAVDEAKFYKLIIKSVFVGKSSIRFKWSRFGYNNGPGIILSWFKVSNIQV